MEMKISLLLLLSLPLLSTAATTWAQEPPRREEPFTLHRATLPNGLRVWVQPRPDSESVAALLVVGTGARYEDAANNGISHYVEHMVFTGTERWTEEEVKNVIVRRGGRFNGWTSHEDTTYFAHVSAEDFDLALDWLTEVVFRATFPEDKVDKEREVIFQERWGRYGWIINTLDSLGFGYELSRDVRRALFPGSTLGLRIVGEDASLEHLDRAALVGYYQRFYVPSNAVLVVVGNVTPEEVLDRARVYLAGLAPGANLPGRPATPPLPAEGPHRIVVRGPLPTDQVQLMIGARTVARTHPDRWALEVLARLLDRQLTEEIRHRQGLVYGLGAYNAVYDDVGYFAVSTTSAGRNRETIQEAVEDHLDRVRRGVVDAEAVAEAKAALKGNWALSMEDNVERAIWLAQWPSVLADDEPVPGYAAAIDAVTPQDLSRVVGAHFTPERSYVGLHQPVVTVASGARVAGLVVVLGLGLWGGRRLWRGARRRRGDLA